MAPRTNPFAKVLDFSNNNKQKDVETVETDERLDRILAAHKINGEKLDLILKELKRLNCSKRESNGRRSQDIKSAIS